MSATATKNKKESKDITVEDKLKALYNLQQIDSSIDRIKTVRGELPLEVQDLEDEIEGLETRVENFTHDIKGLENSITEKRYAIKDSEALIRKYKEQQMNVRNNREFDSLSKEIEYQELEIQLANKRIKEFQASIENKKEILDSSQASLEEKQKDLQHKKKELDEITKETEKEEEELSKKSERAEKLIEDRLIAAYKRIRDNARNGLAVVTVQRDACGGCFNKIPPQRQLEIKSRKKVIVCEHCGRILVDDAFAEE